MNIHFPCKPNGESAAGWTRAERGITPKYLFNRGFKQSRSRHTKTGQKRTYKDGTRG